MSNFEKRDHFFDFIKAFAIFLVLNDHFVGYFAEQYHQTVPFLQLFGIFYGKFGVSLFAIISGYFAYLSGKKGTDAYAYVVKRYLFFFFSCLITNVLYYLFNVNDVRSASSVGMIVGETITLGDYFCPSFWFIRDFFLGCIISFKMGRADTKLADSLIIAFIAYVYGFTFIASVITGTILYHILTKGNGFLTRSSIKIGLLIIFAYSAFYRIENTAIRYTSNAIRALAFILFIYKNRLISFLSDRRITAILGSKTLAILTAHFLMIHCFLGLDLSVPLFVKYILWFIASVIISVPIDYLVRILCSFFSEKAIKIIQR